MNDLKTVLVIGDAPGSIGYDMVCRLLDAGYKVKAPNKFTHGAEDTPTGHPPQMDFAVFHPLVKEDVNFTEIEYDLIEKKELEETTWGCDAVVYLASVFRNCRHDSTLNESISHEDLTALADISKACGVHQFVYGSIPILYRNENDPQATARLEGSIDYSMHDALCKTHPEDLEVGPLVVTIVRPCVIASDTRRRKLEVSITTFTGHAINKTRTRFFGGSKEQARHVVNVQSGAGSSKCEYSVVEFHIESIIDLCLFILEHSGKVNKRHWLCPVSYQFTLKYCRFGRYMAEFRRNPRIPLLARMKFAALAIKRSFDVFMMMTLLQVWPEQVYRYSTRKLLPDKSERFDANSRPPVPFELIEKRTHEVERMEEVNVVMRGTSFDFAKLERLRGPTYLVNFNRPLETQRNVVYLEQSIKQAYRMAQLGLAVCHVEVNRVAENGQTFPPDSYDSALYEKLLSMPNFKRIAIAERICRPFRLPLTSSWRPAGAGVNAICALSYFADTINVYGWDFYLGSSPDEMTYWELFFNLNRFRLDVFRSRLHFECAIINYYYGYHLSKLPNINNYGYLGQLARHDGLIEKIERVLFNPVQDEGPRSVSVNEKGI